SRRRISTGTWPLASRSTRPAPTPRRASAACSSIRFTAVSRMWLACRSPCFFRCCVRPVLTHCPIANKLAVNWSGSDMSSAAKVGIFMLVILAILGFFVLKIERVSIGDVTNQISAIATDVKAITASLRGVMAGPQGEQRLQDIVENVRQITAQVRDLVAANRTNVDATLANTRAITAQLRTEIPRLAESIEKVASSLSGTLGENRQDIHGVVENLRKLSGDMKTTVDNLNAITGQVRSGEGTVGKLLYSDEAHQRLTTALTAVESGVNELKTTLGRANRIALDLGMKAEYQAGNGVNAGTVGNPIGGHSR